MKWIFGIVLGGLCVATVACSSSSGSSGVNSGVDGSKTGADVSDEEAKKICEAGSSYYAGKVTPELACRGVGNLAAATAYYLGAALGAVPSDADLQKACQNAVDECGKKEPDDGSSADPCATVKARPGCTATVDQVEACMTALTDASVKRMEQIPACGSIKADDFKETPTTETPEQPEACDAVPAVCGIGTTDDGNGAGGAGGGAG